MIRVGIVDDHKIVVEGIEEVIRRSGVAEVIAKAYSVKECRETLAAIRPDVLLLDIGLPDGNGMDLCPEIKAQYPEIGILILTSYAEYTVIRHVLDNGASGYILKNADSEEIITGITTVADGGRYICEESNMLLNKIEDRIMLSRRERQLLQLLVEGLTSAEIADRMCLGYETIRTYRKNLLFKFDVHSTAALVRLAISNKLV